LVNGYAGHAAAGWSKPFANSGNLGCYKNGNTVPVGLNAASGLSLVVNDNGPNVTSTYEEAWMIGWETIAGIGAPVGTGSGQFPTPAQLLTTGHVVCRKSASANGTGRAWQLYADYATFYLFVATGDTTGVYYKFGFGDIFSLKGGTDAYRCHIEGGTVENNSAAGNHNEDTVPCGIGGSISYGIVNATPGLYLARSFGGGGTSVTGAHFADPTATVMNSNSASVYTTANAGIMQTPNGPDGSLYMAPLWVTEPSIYAKRGRLRGLYALSHPISNFADGQTFQGGNDYAGTSFALIKQGPNGGMWAVETSATVETN
jgi:hypothetical protein